MTKESKAERRRVRHALQKAAHAHLSSDIKMTATVRQLAVAARKIADGILSGKHPGTAVRL